jgi:hypothetical protein
MVVAYFWNVALSEALYPGLATMEITLRSRIHAELAQREGTEWWFRLLLEPGQLRDYGGVHARLYEKRRAALTAGHVVAELNLGFWTTLLSQPYNQSLWAPNHAALLRAVFPHLPPTPNARHVLHGRYNGLRLLRNRVMHHEPVFHGVNLQNRGLVPLDILHDEVVEAIGWVSPTAQAGVVATDRFPALWSGPAAFAATVRSGFGI